MSFRIAFVYGHFAIGDRYFDMTNIWDSPRGLTGSEISYFNFAREMHRRGHEVHLFMTGPSVNLTWEGMQVHPLDAISTIGSSWDVAYSWHEPDMLRPTHPKLRMVNQQLNDFAYSKPGFDPYVDVYTSPSQHHMKFVSSFIPSNSPDKWEILPNGCDPTLYKSDVKVPGRVIYASSPDRGLHHVLQVWPIIKKVVPEAKLRIFYDLDSYIARFGSVEPPAGTDFAEFAYRAHYIDLAMRRMKDIGVEKCGCVSRTQINQEMSEATVLAYPCDTIRYTEGFSVTTMEACASKTLPIVSSIDALGSIYGECVPMIPTPAISHLDQFVELVVRGLVDTKWRNEQTQKCYQFATQHIWSALAERLESIIRRRLPS